MSLDPDEFSLLGVSTFTILDIHFPDPFYLPSGDSFNPRSSSLSQIGGSHNFSVFKSHKPRGPFKDDASLHLPQFKSFSFAFLAIHWLSKPTTRRFHKDIMCKKVTFISNNRLCLTLASALANTRLPLPSHPQPAPPQLRPPPNPKNPPTPPHHWTAH